MWTGQNGHQSVGINGRKQADLLNHRLSLFFSYYNLEDVSHDSINKYLSGLVANSLRDLECSYCIEIKEVRTRC